MKKVLTIVLLVVASLSGFTQTSEVVIDSSLNKQTLYSNALSFFAMEFKSANNVIQMKDTESGKVIGKGKSIDGNRDITITITCKDGKYKYEIDITELDREITLPIKSLGNGGLALNPANSGSTKAPVIFINNKSSIIKNKIYFKFDNTSWGAYTCYYGNEPSGFTYRMWEKWKILVDEELVNNKEKYENLDKSSDILLLSLVSNLKLQMSKTDF